MTHNDPEYVEVTCTIKHVTDSAVLINDGDHEHWISKSQIDTPDDELVRGELCELLIAEWLANKLGLI